MLDRITKIGLIIAFFAILLLAWPQATFLTTSLGSETDLLGAFPFLHLDAYAEDTGLPSRTPAELAGTHGGGAIDRLGADTLQRSLRTPDSGAFSQEPDDLQTDELLEVAPHLRVETWIDNGQPGAGGNVVLHVQYVNEGDGPAENVVITNTLQGMSYLTDTLGLASSGDDLQRAWSLGTVEPGNRTSFYLYAEVTAAQGQWITNTLDIATSNLDDQGDSSEKHAVWSNEVSANDTDLTADMSPWTGDPAAGQDVVFQINVCNKGSTGSTPVTLTETLPVSMTVQDWWADLPGWTRVSRSAHELVLTVPSVNGWACTWVYVRATVDAEAEPGLELWNQIALSAANDLNLDNNEIRWEGQVGQPRTDLFLGMNWSAGQLVAGGEINYWIQVDNRGNMPSGTFYVTDTLPVSTTFQAAWRPDASGNQPLTPTLNADGVVVWEFSGLDNGYSEGFQIVLAVDPDAEPGTSLVNTAEVTCSPDEANCEDNVSSWTETVYPNGPNLRVRKQHEWHGDGRLSYRFWVENVGDEQVTGIVVTDTYPVDTAFHDEWWDNAWRPLGLDFSHNGADRQLIWSFTYLDPGWSWDAGYNVDLDNPGERMRWYTNTIEVSVPGDDSNTDDNQFQDVAFSGGEVDWVEIDVNQTHIWGCAYNAPVTLTTAYTQTTFGDACWDMNDSPGAFAPGDTITVTAGAGLQPVVIHIPDPFTAYASSITNTVWGQIGTADHEPVRIDLHNVAAKSTTTDEGGLFSAEFGDVPYGAEGNITYQTEIDYAQVGFHSRLQTPDLVLGVNYGHDWIESNYEAGHTFWLTVTNSSGTIKATAEITSGVIPWWPSDRPGVSTSLGNPWSPRQPDIQPGDWVYGVTSNGYSATVQLAEITGNLDVDADTITGTVDAPWLMPGPVEVECQAWGAPTGAPSKLSTVVPDGEGTYSCAWDPSTEWDLRAGQDVGVAYREPDGHQVYNVFRGAAPHLRVETRLEGGQPGVGGNVVFHVQYGNDGDSPAENVVITNTLSGMSYLTDTLDLASSGDASQRAWSLGTVEPGAWTSFYVYAEVTAAQGEWVTNTLDITTSNPDDQGDSSEKHAVWSGEVQAVDTHLNVGISAWTADPAAGEDVVFQINVCNKGSTGSTMVTLTETLPVSMTIQDWWSDIPGWESESWGAHELVLTAPSVNGWTCTGVYVRATVDAEAEPGLGVWNEVTISATNDMEPDDNQSGWEGKVSVPYTDLGINQNWSWGTLVPGGQMHYAIYSNNQGNLPITGSIRITDTLPVGTSLSEWHSWGDSVVELVEATGNQVVWDMDGLDNGYRVDIELVLDIAQDAVPGTTLTNEVEIDVQPEEVDTTNNESVWEETLYPSGPNLRVRKEADWHGFGEGHDAWGTIIVENVGDQIVDDVVVTDNYPDGMVLDGGLDVSYWQWWDWADQSAESYFTVTLESLEPGSNVQVRYNMHIPGDAPIPGGLVYTNTASVSPTAGDTNLEDNSAIAVLGTGPDLYVEKTLVGSVPLPGELVTYTLRFGDDHPGYTWWWAMQGEVVLTDTLPSGTTYEAARLRFCGPEVSQWCACGPDRIVGQNVVWDLGQLGPGNWNEILLTVRISDDISVPVTLENTAVIGSDRTDLDIEPFEANNHSSALLDLPTVYSLEVGVVGSGTVDRDPDQEWYEPSDVVTLTATADAGWAFDKWSGASTSTNSEIALTMASNTVITATFVALPDFVVTKAVTPEVELDLGDVVTYSIELDNNGEGSATGVVITDTLPAGVEFGAFVGNAGGAQEDGGVITWGGTVAAGETMTITFTATLAQDRSLYATTITNRVTYDSANAGDGYSDASFEVRSVRLFLPIIIGN
ncbi:MAG: InlB B-repeat-containing protein [Anaerolineae bacterium]